MDNIKNTLGNFWNFLYNKKTKAVLGRSCSSWVQILAFYIIFYSVLVLIFAIHLGVFMALTPSPHINTTPWNYGRYAYSNYPNAKLDLILVPSQFTFNRKTGVAELDSTDFNRIDSLLNSANISGVNPRCLKKDIRFGFNTGEVCIYLHLAKVFNWTPELINSALKDSQWLYFTCIFQLTDDDDRGLPIVQQPRALPLNLSNNNYRSFPFNNKPDYMIPVVGLFINLTALPSDLPSGTKGVVRCSLNFKKLNMTRPSAQLLNRLYEIPSNATTTINLRQS